MPAKAPNLALAAELGRLLEYSLLTVCITHAVTCRANRIFWHSSRRVNGRRSGAAPCWPVT